MCSCPSYAQHVRRLCDSRFRRRPNIPRMTMVLPEVAPRYSEINALRLWWKADHTGGLRPVQGSWRGARELVRSIDGSAWPFTTIEQRGRGESRFFQVLGTGQQCVLELGGELDDMRTIYRVDDSRSVHWMALPPGCAYWLGAAKSDELITADVAADIGLNWLLGRPLGQRLDTRPAQYSPNRE